MPLEVKNYKGSVEEEIISGYGNGGWEQARRVRGCPWEDQKQWVDFDYREA